MPEPSRTSDWVPAEGPADLTGLKMIELVQPPKPRPYLVPRGHPSYYGYRHGVFVYALGPGGTVGVGDDWPS
jgi:hypothetical protein